MSPCYSFGLKVPITIANVRLLEVRIIFHSNGMNYTYVPSHSVHGTSAVASFHTFCLQDWDKFVLWVLSMARRTTDFTHIFKIKRQVMYHASRQKDISCWGLKPLHSRIKQPRSTIAHTWWVYIILQLWMVGISVFSFGTSMDHWIA